MTRITNEWLSAAGLVACCAAAVQANQLASGQATPEMLNYTITAATSLAGLGLTGFGWWRRRAPAATTPADDRALVTALDQLFVHFGDDDAAQEAVRVVARAVTERRYRKG